MAESPAPSPASTDLAAALAEALAERDRWAQELFEASRFAAQFSVERQALADHLDRVRAGERRIAQDEAARQVDAARQERDRACAQRDRAITERDNARRERDRARSDQQAAAAMLDRVTSSTAWRLTGPMRRVAMLLLGRPPG